jgi:hypothetical protein
VKHARGGQSPPSLRRSLSSIVTCLDVDQFSLLKGQIIQQAYRPKRESQPGRAETRRAGPLKHPGTPGDGQAPGGEAQDRIPHLVDVEIMVLGQDQIVAGHLI